MKKLLLAILLIIAGCSAEPAPVAEEIVCDTDNATPHDILAFYQTLELTEVVADVMFEDGIKEYKLSSPENLNLFAAAIDEIEPAYLYHRPEDALYSIYQLKDKEDQTYILESYKKGPVTYYAVNEYDLAFKTSDDQLYDLMQNHADEVIDTGYKLNSLEEWHGLRGMIDGLVEEGLAKYAVADHRLTAEELMKNEAFLAECLDDYAFSTYENTIQQIYDRLGYDLKFDLPYGPIRYSDEEYTLNRATNIYESKFTYTEYLDSHTFAVAESEGVVICFRFKANTISNLQTLIQMYRKSDRHEYITGYDVLSLLLYHMDEVDLVEVNKNDLSSRVIKEADSKHLKTAPISLADFEVITEERGSYLSLNAEHIAAKLFTEAMYFRYYWGTHNSNHEFKENDKLISLLFKAYNRTAQSFIFSKETGLTYSDAEINQLVFNDPDAEIEAFMAQQNLNACSGIYEEMMNGTCYERIEWSVDSVIEPEYRICETQYQINDQGQLVLPIIIKKQGVFDHYEYYIPDFK